jgi:TPR repeat protein
MKWCILLLMVMRLSGADLESLSEEELRARAAKDDLPAKIELAHRQLYGRVMPFDQKFVLETFRRGSEAGIARAHTGLANCHRWGVGMAYDDKPLRGLLEKAAEMGDAEGTFQLGTFHLKTATDASEAQRGVELIRKAAGMGWADADAYLANLMLTGGVVPPDKQAGLAKLHALAEKNGNAQAAVYLAFHYREVAKDPKNADKFFRIAASQNHAAALIALGDKAMNNGGWKGNKAARQEGAEWYRKAIARNSGEGMRKLAMMQMRDTSVRKKGEDWYQLLLAADRVGHGDATLKLADVNYHAAGYTYRDLDWSKTAHYDRKYLAEWRGTSHPHIAIHRLLEMYFEGGLGLDRDFAKCLEIAQPYFDYCDVAAAYAGRILLHPDAPMGKTREHFIRGYACMLKAKSMHNHISDDALFVLRSRHGMTREEVARAEELFRSGFPNPETPLLP